MSTIGTLVNHGITLGTVTQNGTYASPLTITSTGYVDNTANGDAVIGNTASCYIENIGRISAAAKGNGVFLQAGGTVVNHGIISSAGTKTSGAYAGVYILGTAGVLDNDGTISGQAGVFLISYAGSIFNSGLINGRAGAAVAMYGPGYVSNASTGTLSGAFGIGVANQFPTHGSTTIVNSGTIAGTYGVFITMGSGTLTNNGVITGGVSDFNGNLTVANYGTITPSQGYGIFLASAGSVTVGKLSGAAPAPNGIDLSRVQSAALVIGNVDLRGGGSVFLNDALIKGQALFRGSGTLVNIGGTISQTYKSNSYKSAGIVLQKSTGDAAISNAGSQSQILGYTSLFAFQYDPITISVANYGTMAGSGPFGMFFQGGTVGNRVVIDNGGPGKRYGLISGVIEGIYIGTGNVATIVNFGTITASGTLGGAGIALPGASTLVNAGTISSLGLYSVLFAGGGGDRLVIDPGALFVGPVKSQAGNDSLELAAGVQRGTLDQFGLQYAGFSQVIVDAEANWSMSTWAPTSLSGVTVTVNGDLVLPAAVFSGNFVADGGGTIEFAASVDRVVTTTFSGTGGTLVLDELARNPGGLQRQAFNAPIFGLTDGDKLRIGTAGLGNFSGIDKATPGAFSGGATPLVLTSGGATIATLTLAGNYAGDAFGVSRAVGGFVTVGIGINAATDFNGDGTGDVLFRNAQNGQLLFAAMNGGGFAGWGAATAPLGSLNFVGHGDVNGDGVSDVVVQDPNSGQVHFGLENGTGNGQPSWQLGPLVPGFTVTGLGDIQGDDRADIVIQSGGLIDYYDTLHGGFTAVANATGWNVVGVGDVNGDGYADIVIQNPGTGQISYANMAGGVFNGWAGVATTPGDTVKAVADLTGDGFADIVVQNPSSTAAAVYADMHGGVFNGWGVATTPLTPGYVVADTADVFGTGHADLIVQQQSTGTTFYAQEGANGFAGWGLVTASINGNFHAM